MRSRLMTQVGWKPIRKVWKWVKPSEEEAGLWKDMESRGTNHDNMSEVGYSGWRGQVLWLSLNWENLH